MRNITTSRKAVDSDGHSEITREKILVIPVLISDVHICVHIFILSHISNSVNTEIPQGYQLLPIVNF